MAKKDKLKNENKEVISEDKLTEQSPYGDRSFSELLVLIEKKDQLLAEYSDENSKLLNQLDDCRNLYDEEVLKNQQNEDAIEELNSRIEVLKRSRSDEIAEFKKSNLAEIKQLERNHAAEIDELKKTHAAEIEELNETHAAEIDELKATCKAKLEGQTSADLKKINDLKSEHSAELKDAKALYDANAEKLKKTHKSALEKQAEKLESDWKKKLDKAQAKHDAEVKRLNDRIAELTTLGTEGIYSENLRDDFLAASKKERERLIKLLIAELKESDSNLNGTFDKLKTKAEKKVTRKKEAKQAIDDAKERLAWLEQQNEHNNAERASIEESLDRIYKMLEDDVEDDA